MTTTVCMVNDCSHVGESLLPHLKLEFDVSCIRRTRGLLDKTVGIWWKLRSTDADIYHVHYALQDAYLTRIMRHLDVLHCHGSDIRYTLKHFLLGKMVRGNLKDARKVLYATPDMLEVKRYRPDAEYLPTPVDTEKFVPHAYTNNGGLKAVYFRKWYEPLPPKIPEICKKNDVDLTITSPRIPYDLMPDYLSRFDVYIDRFSISSLSKTALEAMSCGLNIIGYDTHKIESQFKRRGNNHNRHAIICNHDSRKVARQLTRIYEELTQ